MSLRIWIWLLSLSVLWGGSFFFAKVALAELAPLTVVFCRVALAALALNLALAATGRNLFRAEAPFRCYAAMGFLNNLIPFGLIFWGQTQIESGLASILNATTPLFTLLVAHFIAHDERIGGLKLAALVIGIGGVAVLMGPEAIGSSRGIAGQIACLGAALSYAFAGVYGRRFATMGVAPLEAAAGQVTASAMLILPVMLIVDRPWLLPAPPGATTLAALASLALLSTALAYVLYFRILAVAGATNLLLVTFLIPVTAILLGALVLGERLAPRHFAGMTLIGLSLTAIDGRIRRFLRLAK
ncbi:MAG: DMT family transporter [Reyranella sp.]|uniref:DMT family transporter n=1 Tax=Reyranella sp. TaxID=1929291 RepID=UPI0012009681|nr:DMT family transporter [Reyranella sp.]TAJ86903.1 MAG: DMT family transporter [Reyranella sp.]